jgi:hypothetical protein
MPQDPLTQALRLVFAPIVKQSANWPPILAYGLPGIVAVLLIIGLGLVVPPGLLWLLAVVILAPLAGFIFVTWHERHNPLDQATLSRPDAVIEFPKDNQIVGRTIYCGGLASGIHPQVRLWLAVEAVGCIWPKEREISVSDGRWNHRIFEDGGTKKFSVVLLVADPRGDKIIRDWLEAGKLKAEYAEMKGIPGTETLARVENLQIIDAS